MVDYIFLLQDIERTGFFDVVVPFLLVFCVLFTLLEKTKILGNASVGVNVLISLLLSLVAIVNTGFTTFARIYLGNISLVIVLFAVTLLLLQFLLGLENKGLGYTSAGLAVIAIIIALIESQYVASSLGGFYPGYLSTVFLGPFKDILLLVAALGITAFVIIKGATVSRKKSGG